MKDIFLCHSGEDKPTVVRPLAKAFDLANISCWIDEAEILWADSITEKINKGLRTSRYVLVVFSSSFLQKPWPQREFNAAMSREAASGEVLVLPLLVGDKEIQRAIIDKYPLLADKSYLVWNEDTKPVVSALKKRLGTLNQANPGASTPAFTKSPSNIYIPPIRRSVTQRDKDLFVKQAFGTVKEYFQEALKRIQDHYPEVETDYTDIDNRKFICRIYVNGMVKCQCRIWLSGFSSSDDIFYSEGHVMMEDDGTFHDLASPKETDSGLSFQLMLGAVVRPPGEKTRNLSPEELAESLWMRFVAPLASS